MPDTFHALIPRTAHLRLRLDQSLRPLAVRAAGVNEPLIAVMAVLPRRIVIAPAIAAVRKRTRLTLC